MRLFALLLLLLLGCKAVQKSSESLNILEQKTTEDTLSESTSQSLDMIFNRKVDSSIERLTFGGLRIYPRGVFVIQSDGSFKGEADSVISTTQKTEVEKVIIQDSIQVKKDSVSTLNKSSSTDSSTELKSEDNQVNRTPSFTPYLGLGIVLIGVLWFLIWKFSRPKIP